ADVTNDVGNVLVAFFFVGDEGGIVVLIIFDGVVDLDVVFRFGNDGFDLSGILFGVGFLEGDHLFGLPRLLLGLRSSTGASRLAAGARRSDRRDRHDLAGIGRDHRILVQVVELFTRRGANAFGSEVGFGHVRESWEFLKNGASLG